jgi:hypothetical protein
MAIAKKILKGSQGLLSPFYLGARRPTKQGGKLHSHYVLINPLIAPRLGIKARSTHKPTDEIVAGAVFDTKRKYGKGTEKGKFTTTAKRFITQGEKSVELFTGNYVKNSKGKDVQESYQVGFPSSLTMVDIIFFVNKQMPLVKFLRHGGRTYTSRSIVIPKGQELIAEKAVAGK